MAENKEGQEKTEPASAKRFREAREKGQVAKSMDVTTAAVMLIGGLMIFVLGHPLFSQYRGLMKHIFMNSSSIEISQQNILHHFDNLAGFLAGTLLPILVIMFGIVMAAEISQIGFKIASKKFTEGLRFKQIFNPFSGLKKIFFSGRALFELVKSIFKIMIIAVVVWWVLSGREDDTVALIEKPFAEVAQFMVEVAYELVVKVGIIYILIAIADNFYQKYRFSEDLKMTKHEVKEETKQAEGDPKVRARIRQLMRGRIRKMMMQNVQEADVVITNPTHFAVALQYRQGEMNAPKLVAKGADYIAAQIKEIAADHEIPVVEDKPLARTLFFTVDIDQEIPENLFKAVAQVLAYVYQLKKMKTA